MNKTYLAQKTKDQIDAKKASINQLFSDFWFRVPDYQRSYVWGKEQVEELLLDLQDALEENPDKEYFLGSIVLQKYQESSSQITYNCYDILDGQQRITTLLLLLAVLRDLSKDKKLTENATLAIYQEEDVYRNRPERLRVEFLIRDAVDEFIEAYIKKGGGTKNTSALKKELTTDNISVAQMAANVLLIRNHLKKMKRLDLERFAIFLFNKVNLIYVASDTLEDAFRLFTVLNSRGIPLTTSDILKSMNIGKIRKEKTRITYATAWELMEGRLGRDQFDAFLAHVRTIILKKKAKESLLKEYETIYRQGKVEKGAKTLKLIADIQKDYHRYITQSHFLHQGDFKLNNLLTVLKKGKIAADWLPPFLAYCRKFTNSNNYLFAFLERLESKMAADWLLQLSPTQRRNNTYAILQVIEETANPEDVLIDRQAFAYDRTLVKQRLNEPLYKAAYSRYILLKLEYLLKDNSQSFPEFTNVSVEHVLPQKPRTDSQWNKDFNPVVASYWTHRLANLVLLSRRKNSKLNNQDFLAKKQAYFHSSINVFPNVNQVMQYSEWVPDLLAQRQHGLVDLLMNGFK